MYPILLLQFVAACGACALLWMFLRSMARESRFAGNAIAAGFLLRAFGSLATFVVSWCRLPFARSLQIGDGLWFYGLDGASYFHAARRIAHAGIGSYLATPPFPNKIFISLLIVPLSLFGEVTSAIIIFNLFSYLGASWILLRMGNRGGGADVALLLYALSPAMILWSTQPLKDTFFVFVVLLLIFGWQRSVDAARLRRWLPFALEMALVIFAIGLASAVRPYFGLIVCLAILASIPFYLFSVMGDRIRILIVLVLLLLTMAGGFLVGARMFLPIYVPGPHKWTGVPGASAPGLIHSREMFELAGGRSGINAGILIQKIEGGRDKLHRPRPARSLVGRTLAGIVASIIPRTFAQPLLVIVGGGKGLWAFAEIDTVFFTLLLAAALALALREGPFRNPDLAMASILFCGVALPMVYTVSNFGSLLRLRGIVLAVALGMMASCRRVSSPPAPEFVPNRGDHVQNVGTPGAESKEAGAHHDVG